MLGDGDFPPSVAVPVRNRVAGDAHQPRSERHAAELKTIQRGERFVKHLGRDIFRGGAIPHPADNEGVDPLEVLLVQLAELRRIPLGRFNLATLVRVHVR